MANISNTNEYNLFTGNDLGSKMNGYYAEIAYNLLQKSSKNMKELLPFVRYTHINTHQKVENAIVKNSDYSFDQYTIGIGYKITSKSMLKMDVQLAKKSNENKYSSKSVNLGIGFSF